MSDNRALIMYLNYNYYYSVYSPINIYHVLPRYQYQFQPQPRSYPATSPSRMPYNPQQFHNVYTPTMHQHQHAILAPAVPYLYGRPVGYVDEVAIVSTTDESFGYEDMLEIQEQTGRVNVGLSKKTISKTLKTSRISACQVKEGEGEVCAVCQDEYKVNQTIGTLECGHRFHAKCIKQWLLHKNVCPICKATALLI